MKRWMVMSVLVLLGAAALSAGVLTNSNQSATYLRMLSRNPSLDVDAVYYNPAGLVKLQDGFHLAIHNQTITQDKTIVNEFPFLNNGTYVGKVNVPVFPNVYAVYKKDRLAVSFGFGPNAGGGSADYARGLPSFETDISLLPVLISSMGILTTAYDADIAFEGSSIFLGFQGNVSYAVSDAVAVAAGVRFIQAANTYSGYIENIMVNPTYAGNPDGEMMSAETFFLSVGQPLYAAAVSDKEVDAKQTGTAFAPILSLNLTPAERLNISLKYEFKTTLKLVNDTTVDGTGMFPDGEEFRSDIPAILSAGVQYGLTPKWRISASFNYFFDKNANWEGEEALVDSNTYELSAGTEFDVTQAFTLSAGYLRTQFGLSAGFQTDIGHELSADTLGFGARIKPTERLAIDLGMLLVSYKDYTRSLTTTVGVTPVTYDETFSRTTTAFSVGLGYRF
jgi:long-chain fatty acid transport protein